MPDRKTNRIRIDAILNAIRKGEYDDKLPDIRAAVDGRIEHKRQEVLAMVKEVYGEGFEVAPSLTAAQRLQRAGGVLVKSAGAGPAPDPAPETELPTEQGTPDDETGMESRSPIIGPFNPS